MKVKVELNRLVKIVVVIIKFKESSADFKRLQCAFNEINE